MILNMIQAMILSKITIILFLIVITIYLLCTFSTFCKGNLTTIRAHVCSKFKRTVHLLIVKWAARSTRSRRLHATTFITALTSKVRFWTYFWDKRTLTLSLTLESQTNWNWNSSMRNKSLLRQRCSIKAQHKPKTVLT